MRVIFRSKKFDNYNLFRNLLLIFIIIENPTSHVQNCEKTRVHAFTATRSNEV